MAPNDHARIIPFLCNGCCAETSAPGQSCPANARRSALRRAGRARQAKFCQRNSIFWASSNFWSSGHSLINGSKICAVLPQPPMQARYSPWFGFAPRFVLSIFLLCPFLLFYNVRIFVWDFPWRFALAGTLAALRRSVPNRLRCGQGSAKSAGAPSAQSGCVSP